MAQHNDRTYNGWANYATWRVMLELFDGFETETPMTARDVRDSAEDVIESTTPEGIGRDYAMAFLAQVDWHEIADAVNDNNREEIDRYDIDEEEVATYE